MNRCGPCCQVCGFYGDRAPQAHRGNPRRTGLVLAFSLGCAWKTYLIRVGNPVIFVSVR